MNFSTDPVSFIFEECNESYKNCSHFNNLEMFNNYFMQNFEKYFFILKEVQDVSEKLI